ncbi:MAG TPA: PQQ-binding-like beta-propeller repeat protein, partial [Ktedonobacterales bacterium]|nr:PQQ-binding-like beta-propeller repeat protein [Ktedonobacterales bacterium]
FDMQGLSAGQRLDERVQRELTTRDVFVRMCTGALQRSFWSNLEATAFRGLQADDRQKGRPDRRLLVSVIFDHEYQREPFDGATIFIDAVNAPRQAWLSDLRRALGMVATTSPGVSRRAVLGYGAAAVVTLSSTAAATAFFLDYRSRTSMPTAPSYAPGKVIWHMDQLSSKKLIPPLPAVDGSTLYVATGSDLTAYDLANGRKQLWRNHYTPLTGFAPPVPQGGVLYYTFDSTLYALAAQTGKQKWTAQVPSGDRGQFATSPVIGNGAVYMFGTRGALYAFDAGSGTLKWRNAIGAPTSSSDNVSGPAVDGSSVFIGSADHHVYAFNTSDGSERWKFLTRGKVVSTPAAVSGVVFVGSTDNYVYALHAADGSVKWKYLTQGAVQSSPAVADGVVFIGSDDEYLYALDAESGDAYWRTPAGDLDQSSGIITNGGPIVGYPAVTPEVVCIIDKNQHTVRCYDRSDGTQRWTQRPSDSFQNADPIAAAGLILFGSGDQNLYAYGI